jgi:hypothetical protein
VDQPDASNRETEDVITLGSEGRTPRWGLWGAGFAALVVGLGSYQLLSGPSTPDEPPPPASAGAAEGQSGATLHSGLAEGRRAGGDTTVRVAGHRMVLRGPAVSEANRETSAVVVGRLGHSWMIKLTTTACEGPADRRVTYGVADTTGRVTAWRVVGSRRPPAVWSSPGDGNLRLVRDGSHLEVRVTSTGRVLARYPIDR